MIILPVALRCALIAMMFVAGVAHGQDQYLPLPRLPSGEILLKVAYVRNARLPEMTGQQLQLLLETARQGVRESFGINVRFSVPDQLAVQEVFQRFASEDIKVLNSGIYDFKSGTGSDLRLRKAYLQGMGRHNDSLDNQIAYVRPYLLAPMASRTLEGLTDALMATHLQRLKQYRELRLPDGRVLIDDQPFNEYAYWSNLDLIRPRYEVLITNQLLASAEYFDPEVHSAVRGGITNGVTAQNGAAIFGASSVVSTYPFIGDDAVTVALRSNERYSGDEAARYAGYMLVHELGHQLMHLGHPYGRKACVMNPAELLHFRAWVSQLSAKDCAVGASGPMQPGFVKMPLPRASRPRFDPW